MLQISFYGYEFSRGTKKNFWLTILLPAEWEKDFKLKNILETQLKMIYT